MSRTHAHTSAQIPTETPFCVSKIRFLLRHLSLSLCLRHQIPTETPLCASVSQKSDSYRDTFLCSKNRIPTETPFCTSVSQIKLLIRWNIIQASQCRRISVCIAMLGGHDFGLGSVGSLSKDLSFWLCQCSSQSRCASAGVFGFLEARMTVFVWSKNPKLKSITLKSCFAPFWLVQRARQSLLLSTCSFVFVDFKSPASDSLDLILVLVDCDLWKEPFYGNGGAAVLVERRGAGFCGVV